MSKNDKKRNKILDKIKSLEDELKDAISNKAHNGPKIDLPKHQKRLEELRVQLTMLQ